MSVPVSLQHAAEAKGAAAAPRGPAAALLGKALALQQVKDFAGAEELYRRFLKTHPTHFIALNNAALVAKALGKHDVALLRLARAARVRPNVAEVQFNYANTLQEMGRLEEALAPYRSAIALRPDYAKAYLNLGNALDKLRRFEEAAGVYEQRLVLCGEDGETHSNLGHCLKAMGMLRESLVHFVCAATLAPERVDFQYNVGVARYEMRHDHEAIASFRRVLELEPGHEGAQTSLYCLAQLACDWIETEKSKPLVRAATDRALASGKPCRESAFESITRDADPQRNHAVAVAAARAYAVAASPFPRSKPRGANSGGGKIRIAYLSADFREHPVAQVMGGVFARHDRSRFTVTAYSYGGDDGSVWRQRIAHDADSFVDLERVVDDKSARRIFEDGTDILIDLTAWTHNSRPRICALRPAAVQIQYLGFPGTSGASFFDYAIVDRSIVPPAQRVFWTENLVYMPNTYFLFDRDQKIAQTGLRRADFDLPEDGVVFCSFNNTYKIEPVVFSAWMRILQAVPGSVLWLSRAAPETAANLWREAEERGIEANRLVFAPRMDDKAEHLERVALADIALDTVAYNGHTTTADALWSGVPVVAMLGGHFASRASSSLLGAIGLRELVAANLEDYVQLALRLAGDPSERARLRAYLAAMRERAPLFDTDASVANLERAYERIWANYQAGNVPCDIDLDAT